MVLSPQIILMILVAIALTLYAVVVMLLQRRSQRSRAKRAIYMPEDVGVRDDRDMSAYTAFCMEALSVLGINLSEERKRLYVSLGRAGLQTDGAAAKYLFFDKVIKNILYLIAVGLFAMAVISSTPITELANFSKLIMGSVIVYFCMFGPFALDKMTKRHKETLTMEFPDATDLLLVCVEAGMGMDAAIGRVSKELRRTHKTIAAELERTKLELGIFGDRIQALNNFAERANIQSVRGLVSALIQTEKYGTNLASTLRALASDYRTERLLRAEAKAASVGALLMVPIIAGIFFPMMSLIIAPVIITVVQMWPG